MSGWGTCDYEQLKELNRRFQSASDTGASERFTREVLQEVAAQLLEKTQNRTPVKTGALKRGWKIGAVVQRGNMFEIKVYNDVSYAHQVETGYPIEEDGETVGWCEGYYMLSLSAMEIERLAPELIGARAEEFLEELIGGK